MGYMIQEHWWLLIVALLIGLRIGWVVAERGRAKKEA